jgi:hypothetical protein
MATIYLRLMTEKNSFTDYKQTIQFTLENKNNIIKKIMDVN